MCSVEQEVPPVWCAPAFLSLASAVRPSRGLLASVALVLGPQVLLSEARVEEPSA